MTPDLEDWLWSHIRLIGEDGATPREAIDRMLQDGRIRSAKHAWATLEKWSARCWYDYGVSLDLGWRTVANRTHQIAR